MYHVYKFDDISHIIFRVVGWPGAYIHSSMCVRAMDLSMKDSEEIPPENENNSSSPSHHGSKQKRQCSNSCSTKLLLFLVIFITLFNISSSGNCEKFAVHYGTILLFFFHFAKVVVKITIYNDAYSLYHYLYVFVFDHKQLQPLRTPSSSHHARKVSTINDTIYDLLIQIPKVVTIY